MGAEHIGIYILMDKYWVIVIEELLLKYWILTLHKHVKQGFSMDPGKGNTSPSLSHFWDEPDIPSWTQIIKQLLYYTNLPRN